MSFSQKLYLVKEDEYKKFKKSFPKPKNDNNLNVKNIETKFFQDQTEQLADEDANWARISARVRPILQSSFLPANQPISQSVNQSETTASAESDSGGGGNIEAELRKQLPPSYVAKGLRLLKILRDMPEVSITENKIFVKNSPLPGFASEILEDLVRKRKSLLFSVNPLLELLFANLKNPSSFISNAEAKEALKGYSKHYSAAKEALGYSKAATPQQGSTIKKKKAATPIPASSTIKKIHMGSSIKKKKAETPTSAVPEVGGATVTKKRSSSSKKTPLGAEAAPQEFDSVARHLEFSTPPSTVLKKRRTPASVKKTLADNEGSSPANLASLSRTPTNAEQSSPSLPRGATVKKLRKGGPVKRTPPPSSSYDERRSSGPVKRTPPPSVAAPAERSGPVKRTPPVKRPTTETAADSSGKKKPLYESHFLKN